MEADIVTCGDGATCPGGTRCVVLTNPDQELCVDPDQLVACDGKPDYTRCGDQRRCYSGACLAVACGDGRIDRADPNDATDTGEVCDDGNQTGGDGCSSDCISDETCGNGVADPIKGELCDDGHFVQHDGCDSACSPEQPRWVLVSTTGPSTDRAGPAMAYDSVRDRVVLFGGFTSDGTWLSDTWEWNGAHWQSFTPTVVPSPRSGHSMGYDGARERVVLFGGGSGTGFLLNDTWEWDGATWRSHPVLVAPSPRSGSGMTYDPIRRRVVLFGGASQTLSGITFVNDTWEWDGVSWTERTDLSVRPPASKTNPMTFDPTAGRIILFVEGKSETWSYDGTSWIRVATTGPPARTGAALAYDAQAGGVVLFGGQTTLNSTLLADAWLWSGSSWQPIAGGPDARAEAALASEPTRGAVLFGGRSATADPMTWLLRDGAWSGETPLALPNDQTSLFCDRLRGFDVATNQNPPPPPGVPQTFTFDGAGWTDTQLSFSARPSSLAAYDETHGVAVVRGGNGTMLWDGTEWRDVTTSMEPDANGTIGYDGVGVLQFGGNKNGSVIDETWEWNGTTWMELSPPHRPPPRSNAAMAWDPIRRELVLFGGSDGTGVSDGFDDTWIWNGSDWSELALGTHPHARADGGLAWNPARRRITLVAGGRALNPLNDVWELDREHSTWTPVALAIYPPGATGVSLSPSIDGSGVTLVGGQRGVGIGATFMKDVWQLRWDGVHGDETCTPPFDADGDGLIGCADPDCWPRCKPLCPPGASCDTAAPHCGDSVSTSLESCTLCPADTTCVTVCGDLRCDLGETAAACPGDCP